MKINAQWNRHVEAWRESGLSQADYCRQQNLNPKPFHYGRGVIRVIHPWIGTPHLN